MYLVSISFNTFRHEQYSCPFLDNILECILLNGMETLNEISLICSLGSNWCNINIGSGYDLVPSGNKP